MANKKQKSSKPKSVPNISTVDANAWYNEVAVIMNNKFSNTFIISKAKLAFGSNFDELRYKDIKGSLEDRVLNVWNSQI